MTQADNSGYDPNSQPPAGGELQVPKYRLDEIAARLRAAEEANRVKDELLNQFRPQKPQGPQIDLAALGLDEQTGRAVQRLVEQVTDHKLNIAGQHFGAQLQNIAQGTEEAKFLSRFPDKANYVEKINEQRLRHYRSTGAAIDMETAYKLVAFDEMQSRQGRQAPAAPQAPVQQPTQAPSMQHQVQAPPQTPPVNAGAGVGQPLPNGFAPPAQEATWEEYEAALNQEMAAKGLVV